MNKYADILLKGNGIPADKDEAIRYYKFGIDKGDILKQWYNLHF